LKAKLHEGRPEHRGHGGHFRHYAVLAGVMLLSAPAWARSPDSSGSAASDQAALREAVGWLHHAPRFRGEYNYVMTARMRLLFFWVRQDDIGGGYIKVGEAADDPRLQVIELLFGSDPAKAGNVNRWGAATEVVKQPEQAGQPAESSVFLGFMKSSKGSSPAAMEKELSAERRGGQHLFEAIVSRVDRGRAISTTVPFHSSQDYDLHQLPQAKQVAMGALDQDQSRKVHRLEGQIQCGRAAGFLSTVLTLVNSSVAGDKSAGLCYVYNAHQYTMTLESVHAVEERRVHVPLHEKPQAVDQTYRNLQEARFQILRQDTGKKYHFEILVGTAGGLRGVPVQINYQPNWWFQVVLNLKDQLSRTSEAGR
jgi:hypothetical protein